MTSATPRLFRIASSLVLALGLAACSSDPDTVEEFVVQKKLGTVAYISPDSSPGRPVLLNQFNVTNGAVGALEHARDFLAGVQAGKFPMQGARHVRFIASAPMKDAQGNESLVPILRMDVDMGASDFPRFENLYWFDVLDRVSYAEVLHPSERDDILDVCDEFAGGFSKRFCGFAAHSLRENKWMAADQKPLR